MPTAVISETLGSKALTASSRPPRPTSMTATSTLARSMMSAAARVPNSKNVSDTVPARRIDALESLDEGRVGDRPRSDPHPLVVAGEMR